MNDRRAGPYPLQPQAAPPGDSAVESEIAGRALVMMVDDEPITLDVLQAFLEDAGYRRFVVTSEPAKAMELLASERPDVVLTDLMMPVVSGFDILRDMRADVRFKHVPVIVLTSSTDAQTKLKALEMGATDFLAKPVDASELVLRLRNTLAAKAYLDRVTYYDTLTGLHNRRMFTDRLDWTLLQAQRYGRRGALFHINIDRFKKVNEALGPALGDELLQAVARRLEQCIRTSDTLSRIGEKEVVSSLSRLGGDEFAVLAEIEKLEGVVTVSERLISLMVAPFHVGGRELSATCSIGISVFPDDGIDGDSLVKNAATALHFAKQRGGNIYSFYSSDLNDRSLQYLDLHSALRKAVTRGELRLFYQPKVETGSRRVAAAEALLRWQHPERGLVGPGDFIALAEETGLIVEIGAWAFGEACRQVKAWQAQGLQPPQIAVNISGRQFQDRGFLPAIRALLSETAVDPRYLQVELTESILMENAGENISILQELKALGLKLSMDDFGTGYSSLGYLTRFPIDELKIDRSFLMEIGTQGHEQTAPVVVAIMALARSLQLTVVAEGVETEAQWAFLRERGCNFCQGYLFGKPLPVTEFTALLAAA